MFVAIYEFEVEKGRESEFRTAWRETTEGIYRHFGSRGSRLHETDNAQVFVAYAQWPTRDLWAAPWEAEDESLHSARLRMKACLVNSQTVYELKTCDDLLKPDGFQGQ